MDNFAKADPVDPSLSKPDPRNALRDAQHKLAEVADAVRQSADAVARSAAELSICRSEVSGLSWVPEAVAQHHAERIRTGANSRNLPIDLLDAKRELAARQQDLADAESAHVLLTGDYADAQAEHVKAQAVSIAAVTALADQRALQEMDEMRELEAEAAFKRLSLIAYFMARPGGATKAPGALSMLSYDAHHVPLCNAYEAKLPRAPDWSAWRARLAAGDVEAELGGLIAG